MKIVKFIFYKIEILNLFISELSLILRVGRKRKRRLEIFARGHQISDLNEIGQLVQGLFGDVHAENLKKIYFLVSGFFREKQIVSCFSGFECVINSQNFNKIIGAIFEKIEMFYVFLCELHLNLTASLKKKTEQRYFQGDPRYRIRTILIS